jgi:hypothetical protein
VHDEGGSQFANAATKAVVTAKLVGEQKGDKVKILKYRPKTGYTRHAGHRQMYTLLEIQDVTLGGRAERAPKKAAPKAKAKAAEAPTAEAPAGESEPTAVAEESPVEATAPETGAADATGSEA